MSKEQPLVSIITVNYKQAGVTIAFLESLRNISYPNIEVLVVDNGSGGDDAAQIRESAPWANIIASNDNLGFAGGNNLGVGKSKGELLLFINNDVEVPADFLEPLVSIMQQPDVGMASPKIKFFYAPDTIQYAGSTPLSAITMRNRAIGWGQKDDGQFNMQYVTAYAHGAAMITSREVISKVGTMYDGYFLYYEELDWCERIKRAGYKIMYIPESVIYHKESVSTGKQSPLKTYYINRNRLLFIRRNMQGLKRLLAAAYFLSIAFPKRLLMATAHNEPAHRKALIKAILWHINPLRYEFHS